MSSSVAPNYEVERPDFNGIVFGELTVRYIDDYGHRWIVVTAKRSTGDAWQPVGFSDPCATDRFFVYDGSRTKKALPLRLAGTEYDQPLRPVRRVGHRAPTIDRAARERAVALGDCANTKCGHAELGDGDAGRALDGSPPYFDNALARQFRGKRPERPTFVEESIGHLDWLRDILDS